MKTNKLRVLKMKKMSTPPIVQKMSHFFWEPCAKVCHFKLKVKNVK